MPDVDRENGVLTIVPRTVCTAETFIDEFKNGLSMDRLSCRRFTANAFRLVLAAVGRRSELLALPTDRPVAVFALNMATESVLLRGGFRGFRAGGLGALDIDWVYNSMPPQQGQIFPPLPLEPVRQF